MSEEIMTSVIDLKIKEFAKVKNNYSFSRLLLKDQPDFRGFDGTEEYSIAFISFFYGDFLKLNSLFERFNIEKKATEDFKGRLAEGWLSKKCGEKRFQIRKNVQSAIIELLAADYIEKREEIVTMSALDKLAKSDIHSKEKVSEIEYYTEVKYLAEMPDLHSLNTLAFRRGGVAASTISPPARVYNYICFIIATAVSQFDNSCIEQKGRRLLLVIDPITWSYIERSGIIKWLMDKEDWFGGANWTELIKSLTTTEMQQRYIEQPVRDYISKIPAIEICREKEWNLEFVCNI